MGYTITIGEAEPQQIDWDDLAPGDIVWTRVEARREQHDDAPVFPNDGLTANTNERSPSYTVWDEFARHVGLYEMFFGSQDGESEYRYGALMREHPGAALLGPQHAREIRDALERYRGSNPYAQPGFEPFWIPGTEKKGDPVPENCDAQLARLIWLDYWVNWAVENCEHPIMENT